MAEPNPDDGLVPDISELYKRNPEKWREEARRRTKVDATNDQLVVMERSLDRECAAATAMEDDAAAVEDEKHVATISKRTVTGGVIANSNSTDGKEEKVVATTAEVANDDILQKNGRETKRSKLSSRK
jgi:hypothetical protein